MSKRCTKCQQDYPATTDYFPPNKLGKYGVGAECRPCMRLRYAEYRKRNAAKVAANTRAYHKAHPEWSRETKRRHYDRHRDKVIAKSKKYREQTPNYWKLSQGKEAAKSATRRARKRNAPGKFTVKDIRRKLSIQRGRCFYCHHLLGGQFQVDHYIPLSRGGSNWPDNIVIACTECNLTKGDRMPGDFVERFLNVGA